MKTIKFIGMVVLSAAIAFTIAYFVADNENTFGAIVIFGTLLIALLIGAFDEREKTRYQSIKHRMGIKKAA